MPAKKTLALQAVGLAPSSLTGKLGVSTIKTYVASY